MPFDVGRAYRLRLYRAGYDAPFRLHQFGRPVAARLLRLAERLDDDAVVRPLAKSVVDGRAVALPSIRGQLWSRAVLVRLYQHKAACEVVDEPLRRFARPL